jgi:hypothetical protein
LAALKGFRDKLHPLCKHLHWRSEREAEGDESASVAQGEEELLAQGRYIPAEFFEDISVGLTKAVLLRHEQMLRSAEEQLVSSPALGRTRDAD